MGMFAVVDSILFYYMYVVIVNREIFLQGSFHENLECVRNVFFCCMEIYAQLTVIHFIFEYRALIVVNQHNGAYSQLLCSI